MKIVPNAFKQYFQEPEVAQGVDPVAVSSHMQKIYGVEAITYPIPPYTKEQSQQVTTANKQAVAICSKMVQLGFSNFMDLKSKFQNSPQNEFEARQMAQIKETMEAILFKVETSPEQAKETIVSLYKDRIFECKDGTLTNLQTILADLSLGDQGIDAYVIEQERRLVTQIATDMYRHYEFSDCRPIVGFGNAMEIHHITSLVNAVAPAYGLKSKSRNEDRYLTAITNQSRKKLSKALEQGLEQESTVNAFLDGIAMNVTANLPFFIEGQANFVTTVNNSLETLKLNTILGAEALLKQVNNITTGYKSNVASIIKDATIIYLHDKGLLQVPELEIKLAKLRIELEKGASVEGNTAVTKEILDKANEDGQLEYALKYAIDNKLELDIDDEDDKFYTKDPMQYAIANNIKIDGIDPKQYALKMVVDEYIKADDKARPGLENQYKEMLKRIETEGSPDGSAKTAKQCVLEKIIEQYLETNDPALQQNLKEKYAAAQKLGEEEAPKLLDNTSNLWWLLFDPKAPEILANYKEFKGKSVLVTDIDYTKCDLDLIKRCKIVHERTSKARDYDTLSTTQKVGVAFATIVPIIGNAIAYYAMKSHNKSEQVKLVSQSQYIYSDISGNKISFQKIKTELASLSTKNIQKEGKLIGNKDAKDFLNKKMNQELVSSTLKSVKNNLAKSNPKQPSILTKKMSVQKKPGQSRG